MSFDPWGITCQSCKWYSIHECEGLENPGCCEDYELFIPGTEEEVLQDLEKDLETTQGWLDMLEAVIILIFVMVVIFSI